MKRNLVLLRLRACVLCMVIFVACGAHAGPPPVAAAASNSLTLVKDGKPAATVIISAEPNEAAWFGAGELVDHVHKITGATLPIVFDKEGVTLPDGVKILVGESRLTKNLQLQSSDFTQQEYVIQFAPDTLLLMGRDETGSKILKRDVLATNVIPDAWKLQGTSYAVHDFLERHCDVRWYAPGPLGMVYPTQSTLVVTGSLVRRKPWLEYRGGFSLLPWGMAPNATNTDLQLHMNRLRGGGKWYAVSHAFEGYPDRFFQKNPGNPSVWEGEHLDYFAKDANGDAQPYQMCFSSTGLLAQVVKDAGAFFANQPTYRADGGADYFSIVPRDVTAVCLCKKCKAEVGKADPHFSNGQASRLVWRFTAAVANQFAKKFPGKYVGQLAYRNWAFFPNGMQIPTNVMVGPCMWDEERLWSVAPDKYELKNYKTWVAKAPGRLTSMWLYQCFPMQTGDSGGFRSFPGFYAHVLQDQMKMFAADGVRGINLCGTAEYIDGYLTLKLMDDPTLNVDQALKEFFERYYGPAATPMSNMYRRIETTFCNVANYANGQPATTEVNAWKNLGSDKVMSDLKVQMEKATSLATSTGTNDYSRRVAQFDRDILDYMVHGHDRYLMKIKFKTHADAARKKKPPKTQIALLPTSKGQPAGDPRNVNWTNIPAVGIKDANDGFPADRPASFQMVHDGTNLYLKLTEITDTSKIEPGGLWWAGDHWSVMFSKQETGPYKYFRVPFQGHHEATAVDPDQKPPKSVDWASKITLYQNVKSNEWDVLVAMPFAAMDDQHPVVPGNHFYFEVIRNSFGGDAHLAWAPTFEAGYFARTLWGTATLLTR